MSARHNKELYTKINNDKGFSNDKCYSNDTILKIAMQMFLFFRTNECVITNIGLTSIQS